MENTKFTSTSKKHTCTNNPENTNKTSPPITSTISDNPKEDGKKKSKIDISNEVVLNFKYDDYEPIDNKYKPQYKKNNRRNIDNSQPIDILDQNRFKFILNLDIEENTFNKYLYNQNSNLKWEDIFLVICYFENIHTCTICLEKKMVCPQITRCGHIFCWPCIDNYYDYWTITAINKKKPKCPLCMEYINPEELKICEIIQCVSYLDSNISNNYNEINTDNISFNLIMKEKKSQVLYNINTDPDLTHFKENYLNNNKNNYRDIYVHNNTNLNKVNNHNQKNKQNIPSSFNFLPLEKSEEFSFSRIFKTKKEYITKRLKDFLLDLEQNLKEELDTEKDVRRINSLSKCIDFIKCDLIYYEKNNKNLNNNNNLQNNIRKSSIITSTSDTNKQSVDFSYTNSIVSKSDNNENLNSNRSISQVSEEKLILSNRIIENLSTVDEDLSQNNLKLNNYLKEFENLVMDFKNYFFFYQEQAGDIYLLHPINFQILLKEYELEDHLPTQISVNFLK